MERRTNKHMYEWTDKRKSKNYIPPHTSYVRGIMNQKLLVGKLNFQMTERNLGCSELIKQIMNFLENWQRIAICPKEYS